MSEQITSSSKSKPSPKPLRVACISDTHGRDGWLVPDCDVFVHAGDITSDGSTPQTNHFLWNLQEIMQLDAAPKHAIIVPGNHDRCFEGMAPGIFGDNVHILINSGVTIAGRTFWGSPWTPPFMQWSFMAEESELAAMYREMPSELDLLITHGPPRGILDPGWKKPHAGSIELYRAVAHRSINHHVFGHLHGAGGQTLYSPLETHLETTFYNVSAVDEAYNLQRGCKIIEL